MDKKKKRSVNSRALIPYDPAIGSASANVWEKPQLFYFDQVNPFHAFMLELTKRQQETTTMMGSARWSSFPIEYALSAGLWLIIVSFANKLNRTLATEREVGFVAQKVNHFVNLALALEYKTADGMSAAADAFQSQVVDLVELALIYGFLPGMEISMDEWRELRAGKMNRFYLACRKQSGVVRDVPAHLVFQKPVALFFSDLIKKANAFGENFRESLNQIFTLDRINGDNFHYSEDGLDYFHLQENPDLKYFDLLENTEIGFVSGRRSKTAHEFISGMWNLHELPEKLARQERDVRLARQLPANLNAIFAEKELSFQNMVFVDLHWLNAQILLAANDLPDRDYIFFEEYPEALAAAKAHTSEVLVRKVINRWREHRQFVFPDAEVEQDICELIRTLARRIIVMYKLETDEVGLNDIQYVLFRKPKK